MFFDTRNLIAHRHNIAAKLEVGETTTLIYSIVNPVAATDIDTVTFKLEVLNGRSKTLVTDWSDATAITDSTFSMDVSIEADKVKSTDQLALTIKVTETDGLETFIDDLEVKAI